MNSDMSDQSIVREAREELTEKLTIGTKSQIARENILWVSPHSFVVKAPTPLVPSHVLVFPKRIVGSILELTEEEYLDIHQTCMEVGGLLKQQFSGDGVSIFCNDIVDAGKALAHTYFNVMSRTPEDASQNDHFYDITEMRSAYPAALA